MSETRGQQPHGSSLVGPLAITHTRDPENPRTWTGVPLTLIKLMRERGIATHGIHSGIRSRAAKLMFAGRSVISGYGPWYFRARPARHASAEIVQEHARRLGCRVVLHCGTLDLPMRHPDDLLHVMYTDTTWDMWQDDTRYRMVPRRLQRHTEALDVESYRQLSRIFVFSHYVRGRMIDRYGVPAEKIVVVGSGRGSDFPLYDGPKNYRSDLILFVARHRFIEKGGELMLKAFEIARLVRPKLRLVMLGSDAIARRVGSRPGVEVKGRVPLEELRRLYQEASLFAMPALTEPYGQVYLEALASRTPVLGLNRFAFPELCGNGRFGFIVDQDDPAAVAEAICQALDDPQRLALMGEQGQAFAAEFTWNRVVERLIQGIQDLNG